MPVPRRTRFFSLARPKYAVIAAALKPVCDFAWCPAGELETKTHLLSPNFLARLGKFSVVASRLWHKTTYVTIVVAASDARIAILMFGKETGRIGVWCSPDGH